MNRKRSLPYSSVFLFGIVFFGLSISIAGAQSTRNDLQWYLETFTGFFNATVVPFFFALAILFLMVNILRYFIIDGADASSREQAKQYMMYAVVALVFLTSIWGIIELFIWGLDINDNARVCPDYNPNCGANQYNVSNEDGFGNVLDIGGERTFNISNNDGFGNVLDIGGE